jgi:hypothetical protein
MAMFAWTDPTMPTHDNFPSDFNAKHRLVRSEGLEPPRFYSLPPRASAIPPRAHGIPAQGSGRINGVNVTIDHGGMAETHSAGNAVQPSALIEIPTSVPSGHRVMA